MKKLKLGVVFGGMSTENEVSIVSANSILRNLDCNKYEIYPIYIDKSGIWYKYLDDFSKVSYDGIVNKKEKIENVIEYLKDLDVIFPVLHGLYGEDGTIQGLFELIKVPYVGCKVLASSVGMDKVYSKIIFEKAGLNQTKYIYLRNCGDKYIYIDENFNEKNLDLEEICKIASNQLKYPMFVKPSNSGSSVGITKVDKMQNLKDAIMEAAKFDKKIIIEEGIKGREVECAVLGNEEVKASCVGEVLSADVFYSYDAKYKNQDSRTVIPADIDPAIEKEIQKSAIKAFKAIDGKGVSRVDFFIENVTNKIYINEINTLPGFTDISMYPKLFEASGIKYKDLLDEIINLALKSY